jgi:membrane protease YdiL (CAAX protease family)
MRGRSGYLVHVLVLAVGAVAFGVLGLLPEDAQAGDASPLLLVAVAIFAFGLMLLVAWLASRFRAEEVFLRWTGRADPVFKGFLYSVGFKFALALVVVPVVRVALLLAGVEHTESVPPAATAWSQGSPSTFVLALTAASFLAAGLCEELWRAGLIAGLRGAWPEAFAGTAGDFRAVALAAAFFGFAHAYQGVFGSLLAGVLGIGLGWIMVRHRSIWVAVFCHGFFNAETFVALRFLGA